MKFNILLTTYEILLKDKVSVSVPQTLRFALIWCKRVQRVCVSSRSWAA